MKRWGKLIALLMSIIMLITAIPFLSLNAAGEEAYVITITADKTSVSQGEVINYTISLGPVEHMGTMQMVLDIPDGLTYVPGSCKIPSGLRESLGFDTLEWTEQSKMINGVASAGDYESAGNTKIAEFQCTADSDFTGTTAVSLTDLEFYSCETWEQYTYRVEAASVTVQPEAEEQYTISLSEDKSTITTDEVTFTITLGPVKGLGTMAMKLDLPAGLVYVTDSFDFGNAKTTLGFDYLDFTENVLLINGGASAQNYESAGNTVLGTFRCKAAQGYTGTAKVSLIDLEIYSIGTWTDQTAKYNVTGASVNVEAAAHTHTWGDWTVTTPATCTENGVETRACSGCGETETRVIPASGHQIVKHAATAPTGPKDGNLEYYECENCHTYYMDNEEGVRVEVEEGAWTIESLHKQFVRRLYKNALNRDPDPEGFRGYVEALDAGMTGAEVAAKFIFSPEMKKRSLCNDCLIDVYYKVLLDREAEPVGKAYWKSVLEYLGKTRYEAFIMFIYPDDGINEFAAICGRYEVVVAKSEADINTEGPLEMDISPIGRCTECGKSNVDDFITRLYQTCLGREPDETGLNSWIDGMYNSDGYWSCYRVAYHFVFGDQTEGGNHELIDQNLCNEHFIRRMYHALLDRSGSQVSDTEVNSYVALLDNGVMREKIFELFVESEEFQKMCFKAGVARGLEDRYPLPAEGEGTYWDETKPCAECVAAGRTTVR